VIGRRVALDILTAADQILEVTEQTKSTDVLSLAECLAGRGAGKSPL